MTSGFFLDHTHASRKSLKQEGRRAEVYPSFNEQHIDESFSFLQPIVENVSSSDFSFQFYSRILYHVQF
jgi:hypothetical protein